MTISNFRELRVWQTAMELVVAVYDLTRSFPPEERYGLVNQMRRAAVSIPSNIAEGNARESSKEYLKHLSIAQGSLAELQTQLEIALRLGFTEGAVAQQCLDTSVSVARQHSPCATLLPAKSKRVADVPIPYSPTPIPPYFRHPPPWPRLGAEPACRA